MSYIAFEPGIIHYISYALIGIGVLTFLLGAVLMLIGRASPIFAYGGAIVLLCGSLFFVMAEPKGLPTAQDRAVAEAIDADYGIELTDEELLLLDYPQEKPTGDFEAFGSFEQMLPDGEGGYELNRIFLIWEDGEMKLAKSTDGESFTPLKADS